MPLPGQGGGELGDGPGGQAPRPEEGVQVTFGKGIGALLRSQALLFGEILGGKPCRLEDEKGLHLGARARGPVETRLPLRSWITRMPLPSRAAMCR